MADVTVARRAGWDGDVRPDAELFVPKGVEGDADQERDHDRA